MKVTKLTLNKETVRKLNDAELQSVQGGATGLCGGTRVGTRCCPCTGTSNPTPTRGCETTDPTIC
jgi:hypothetical protein